MYFELCNQWVARYYIQFYMSGRNSRFLMFVLKTTFPARGCHDTGS